MTTPIHVPSGVEPLARALVASPDPVFITDRRNRVVFWNQSAERLLGYAAGEVAGVSCAGLLQGCDVHGMLAAGQSTPAIAARLHISILTARNHIQNILEKLEVHSKAEAVAFAFKQRLL